MAGQKARSAVFAPEVPANPRLVAPREKRAWMPGHQGVYARLRRAMPGHDGADGCHDAFVARRLFGARSRMSRKSGYRFSEKDMRQRKISRGQPHGGYPRSSLQVVADGGRPATPRSRVPGSAEILSLDLCSTPRSQQGERYAFFFDRNCPESFTHRIVPASPRGRCAVLRPLPLRDNEAQCNPLNGQGKTELVSRSVSLSRLRFHTAA